MDNPFRTLCISTLVYLYAVMERMETAREMAWTHFEILKRDGRLKESERGYWIGDKKFGDVGRPVGDTGRRHRKSDVARELYDYEQRVVEPRPCHDPLRAKGGIMPLPVILPPHR